VPSGTHHFGQALTMCCVSERNRCRLQLYKDDRTPDKLCLGPVLFREGRLGRLVWRGNSLLRHQ
jgi:hypothetical protein